MTYFVKEREPEDIVPLLFISHLDAGDIVDPSRATIDRSVGNVCSIEDFHTSFRTQIAELYGKIIRLVFDEQEQFWYNPF